MNDRVSGSKPPPWCDATAPTTLNHLEQTSRLHKTGTETMSTMSNSVMMIGRCSAINEHDGKTIFLLTVTTKVKVETEHHTTRWDEETNTFFCLLEGKNAKRLAGRLNEGMRIAIDGRLRLASFEDYDGTSRTRPEIVVNDLFLIDHNN